LRFHDLRHTFATRLVHAGVDIITLKDLLGHTKITTTARYTHPLADDKMAAVKRLDFAGVR
jgi:site-specific recombinase XerD